MLSRLVLELSSLYKKIEKELETIDARIAKQKGERGVPGPRGLPGTNTPRKGVDYFTDADKKEIATIVTGMVARMPQKGEDGKTPQKYVDYFTDDDIDDLIEIVKRRIKLPKDGKDSDTNRVIEEVFKKIEGKSKEGLEQTVRSFVNQTMARGGYMHGGGDTVAAGSGISITETNGTKVISATGSGAVDSVNGQTGVVVLDTGDIAESTDANYVTDAQETLLDNITASATEINYTDGVTSPIQTQLDAKAAVVNVQVFTTPGANVWTKPANAKWVEVTLIGSGGGGGSGRKGAAGTDRIGGAGGGAGGYSFKAFPASILGSTESVIVGVGGTGGLSQSTNSTNGNAGSNGENTSFGSWLVAEMGYGGEGGTDTQANGGIGGYGLSIGSFEEGNYGGFADNTGAYGGYPNATSLSIHDASSALMVSSGGAGGIIPASNTPSNGADGGVGSYIKDLIGYAGGTAGVASTSAGGNGTSTTANYPYGGGGGGGGGARHAGGNAFAGGNGGLYGAGGGGGGAATNSVGNSGAGGNGAQGIAIVTTYF